MDSIRNAFDLYLGKLENYCEKEYGSPPTIPSIDGINDALLMGSPDSNGEAVWRLVPVQRAPDWKRVELQLCFSLSEDIRAFFGTYLFGSLSGYIGDMQLYIEPHFNEAGLEELILAQHNDALSVFLESQRFLIGDAVWQGDDEYGVYYDNLDGSIFCYSQEDGKQTLLAHGFEALILEMEAFD